MTDQPRVTIVTPTYNRADLLPYAIDAALAQTFVDFELLIIDDGSEDETDAVIARYDDPRIRYEKNPSNLGLPATRNRSLDLARGAFIANLDSDDLVEPGWLAATVSFLDANPDVDIVGVGKRPMSGLLSPAQRLRHRPRTPEAIDARLLFRACVTHSSMTARTAALRQHRYDETLPVCEDYDLFARLTAAGGKIANIPDRLVRVRRHRGRITSGRDRTAECLKRVLAEQLDRLGLGWSDDDLELHYRLSRPRSWHRPTPAEIPAAEAWLARLADANRASGRYPEAALNRILGEVWLELWFKALPGSLLRPARWFGASPVGDWARRSFSARLRGGDAARGRS